MIATVDSLPTVSINDLHAQFLTLVLPRIQTHAAVVFRGRKADEKTELLADAIALAWKWFVRLVQRDKDPRAFPTAIATLVCRAVKCGPAAHWPGEGEGRLEQAGPAAARLPRRALAGHFPNRA
jgi:hypothetical protein